MKRSINFLIRLLVITSILAVLLLALYLLNTQFHFLDKPVSVIDTQVKTIDKLVFTQVITGVSIGVVIILGLLFIAPFFMKNVDTRTYLKSIVLGLVASFVFFLSERLYAFIEKYSQFYMIVCIVAVIVFTVVVVEFLSLAFKSRKNEMEFRTSVLSGIASGLIFSILLKLTTLLVSKVSGLF